MKEQKPIVENLSVVSNDTAGRFLINVIAAEALGKDLLNKFRFSEEDGHHAMADVVLTINGVPVNFTRAINDTWERLVAGFDEAVLKEAKALVSASRLDKLSEILTNAEYRISQEIEELFAESKKPEEVKVPVSTKLYTLEQALATPGVHCITSRAMSANNNYFVVEVDTEGNCHQLNTNRQRDGILSPTKWKPGIFAFNLADLEANVNFLKSLG